MKVTEKNRIKISKLKSIYVVVLFAKWTVREFKWTGKYVTDSNGDPCPLVWVYYENYDSAVEKFIKAPIYSATSGWVFTWSFNKEVAETIARSLRYMEEHNNEHL